MELEQKLDMLGLGAQYDVCGSSPSFPQPRSPDSSERFLTRAVLPNGGSVCLFKVLLTNVCLNDCAYCVNRSGRDIPRSSFRPEELAATFMELHRKRLAQGLFLTSGIAGNAARTQELMINTVEILRQRYLYKGYVHLKVLPGAPRDCVEEACRLANRVSVNMEAPTVEHLSRLSARKDLLTGIMERMRWIRRISESDRSFAPAGQTTQFVVGAAGESDRDLLTASEDLYRQMGLRRIYFSAFRPIDNSPLEGRAPTPPMREHRLYEADWLLREYGFTADEVRLGLQADGNFSLEQDPKLAIAARQPWLYPLDVNVATYEQLLRVPGIGPTSARRIVETRRDNSISSLRQLGKLRVVTTRAAPFIWFQGIQKVERQLALSVFGPTGRSVRATPALE